MKENQVPLKICIGWGFGGLADNFMFNTLTVLGTLVYVNHFRMSPEMAGIALAMPRLIDAFTDLWIGNISDNAKTRFGRRRPFMFAGCILSAVLLPLLWTPVGLDTLGRPWYQNLPFIYICVVGSLLAITYTLYVVPYTALGYELTSDYDERTRVMAWRMYIGLAASLGTGWLFRLCSSEFFPHIAAGAMWVSTGIAAIVVVAGLIPVFSCKENLLVEKQPKIRLLTAIGSTLSNRPLMIVFSVYVIVIVSLFSAQSIAPLLLQHYVFGGSEKAVGNYLGWMTSITVALSYISLIFVKRISQSSNKRSAMLAALGFILAGTVANFFAIDPRWPWALYVASGVAFLGIQGCWLMVDSMVADICDDDELHSGLRREGMFGAVKGFSLKLAQGITFGIGGYLAALAGYDPDLVNTTGLSVDTANRMKAYLIGFQVVCLIIGMLVMSRYPITRERAEKTRQLLNLRKKSE